MCYRLHFGNSSFITFLFTNGGTEWPGNDDRKSMKKVKTFAQDMFL